MNESSHELREENNRLINELSFERNLNTVLENIRNYSLVLINNCKCDQNSQFLQNLNELQIKYANLKASHNTQTYGSNSVVVNQQKTEENVRNITTNKPKVNKIKSKTKSKPNQLLITELLYQNKVKTKDLVNNSNHLSITNSKVQQNTYRCTQCNQCFGTELYLLTHLSEVHKILAFECDLCDYKSYKKSGLTSHKVFHSSQDVECNECHLKFVSQKSLISHLSNFHRIPSFECNYCSFKALNKTQIRLHKNTTHFQCIECEEQQSFESQLELEIHINSVHKSIESYVCHECKQLFNCREMFETHLQIHNDLQSIDIKPNIDALMVSLMGSSDSPTTMTTHYFGAEDQME